MAVRNNPVSYTHLDVYKRQVPVPDKTLVFAIESVQSIIRGAEPQVPVPVSYTHLDVYKRQSVNPSA